jgi:hypothetical protein
MKPEIINSARELKESPALRYVLDNIMEDLSRQFMTTPEAGLCELQRLGKAVETLRGKIDSELLNILET